jgi:murein DD-endopeptidase MepM/ murein hydrolase activator NlpD
LDHGKRRGAHRTSGEGDHIDLGHEPPLSVDGETSNFIDRRRVSVQWFSGTILTGLCGAALMGGAVFASLDGQSNFATVPERVQPALRGSSDRAAPQIRRLPPPSQINSQRRIIRDTRPTASAAASRSRARLRACRRQPCLSTSSCPPIAFNRCMQAELTHDAAPADEAPDAAVDAEVSFVTADLANVLPRAKIAAVLSVEDVMGSVREAANWTGSVPARHLTPEMQRGMRLAYAAEGNLVYAGFETRIAPENVTLLPKTETEATGGTPWIERIVTIRKGDTVTSVLRDLGARPDDIRAITAALGPRGRDGGVREIHTVRVLMAPTSDPKVVHPIRVVIANDSAIEAVVAWSDIGRYVQVDIRNLETEVASSRQQDEEEDDGRGVRLYQSIYETALRNQVPRPLIEDIIRIYSYDIDFQRRVQPGDSFEIFFASEDESAESKGEVLYASLTTGGETRRYYRYQSPDDGLVDFYDETDKSAKKFLVRKPLADGIMRSGFGNRHHPLLRYTKMHTGVDWAAPMGTPIYASGNGVIDR